MNDFLAIFEPILIPFFVNVLCPESLLLGVLLDGSVSMFPGSVFPVSYVPRVLCSPGPMFPGSFVPRVLCWGGGQIVANIAIYVGI